MEILPEDCLIISKKYGIELEDQNDHGYRYRQAKALVICNILFGHIYLDGIHTQP